MIEPSPKKLFKETKPNQECPPFEARCDRYHLPGSIMIGIGNNTLQMEVHDRNKQSP